MSAPLVRLLLVDDNEDDRTLVRREVARACPQLEVIEARDEKEFQNVLDRGGADLVITDYQLQWSTGLKVLDAVKQRFPDSRVIMFTGTGTQEIAVDAMKHGLDDYILKAPAHFVRLPAAVAAALQRRNERIAKRRAEVDLRESREWLLTTISSIGEAVIATDNQGRVQFMNPAAEDLTGFQQEEVIGRDVDTVLRLLSESGEPLNGSPAKRALASGLPFNEDGNYLLLTKSGARVPIVDGAAPIKNPSGEIAGAVITVRDMTERKRIENELVRSNQELMQFAYTASHDLREPLRSVTACTELLARTLEGKLDPEQEQLMNFISGEGAKMSTLVQGLLDLGRVSHEAHTLRTFPASESVEQAIAALRTYIQEKNAAVTYDWLPVVTADPEQLASVFQNLISNGIKYQSSDRPEVRVTAEQRGDHHVFCVEDNGLGIAPRYHEEIFRIFSRLHPKQFRGTGIGLATTKRIIERHGGSIWLASEEGQGSRFFFSLPIRAKQGESVTAGARGRGR